MGLAAFNRMRRRQAEMAEAAALEENKGEDLGDQDPGKTDQGDQDPGDQDPGNTDLSGNGDPDQSGESDTGNTDLSGNGDPDQSGESDTGNTNQAGTGEPINYDSMSYDDLKALVKERGIPYASVKKVDLIEALKASK